MRYLLMALLFCSFRLSAQKIRFTDPTNHWYGVSSNFSGSSGFHTSYTYDTVINGKLYKRFEDWSTLYNGYIREDTVLNKVFVYAPDFSLYQDTIERVLYDYTLQLNDTFTHVNLIDTFLYTVSSLDSTLINNAWHKVWRLTNLDPFYPPGYYDVVEGIGSTTAPWFPMYSYTFEHSIVLYCFYNNSDKPYIPTPVSISQWYFNNDRLTCYAGIEHLNVTSVGPIVSPNPVTRLSRLIFWKRGFYQITLYNGLGQLLIDEQVYDTDAYEIGKKIELPGLYHYKVRDLDGKRTYTGKLVMP